jgi:Family of unknown function (DUF5678)
LAIGDFAMTQNVNVPLSDWAYQRLKRWADEQQQNLGEAIATYLVENPPDNDFDLVVPPYESDPLVEEEKAAYIRMFPMLKEKYHGQYVAIYNGKLIDYDTDYGRLFERIDDTYPETFVWLTRVMDEPIGTLHFRSPRLIETIK